jgi:hypothetical protein
MREIKTEKRNKLRTHTLSALMELGANGPPFPLRQQPTDAVSTLVNEALKHWMYAKKRNVRKSHLVGRAGRSRSTAPGKRLSRSARRRPLWATTMTTTRRRRRRIRRMS